MFFLTGEGARYMEIGLKHSARVDGLSLPDRFRRREEIAQWINEKLTAMRVEVLAFVRRIDFLTIHDELTRAKK